MGDFNFFGTWDDTWEIISAILESGEYALTPDLPYPTSVPLLATTWSDSLVELCRVRGNVYLWSTQFSVFSPHMVTIAEGKHAGKYDIDMSKSGPGLELHLPPCYEEDGVIQLAPGSLWYHKRTWNPDTRLWDPPSPELKAGFRSVRSIMKKHLLHMSTATSKISIGSVAKHLVETHQALLHGV